VLPRDRRLAVQSDVTLTQHSHDIIEQLEARRSWTRTSKRSRGALISRPWSRGSRLSSVRRRLKESRGTTRVSHTGRPTKTLRSALTAQTKCALQAIPGPPFPGPFVNVIEGSVTASARAGPSRSRSCPRRDGTHGEDTPRGALRKA